MAETITVNGFNRVELLIHPFFALENVRRKGSAGPLKNISEEEILADYKGLGLVENWKRKVEIIKNNPSAVMIICGPMEFETQNPRKFFFTGRLTKQKLSQFSKEYQEFLKYARNTLGRRLFYVSHTFIEKDPNLSRLMWARKLLPYKNLRVYAYGEWLATTDKGRSLSTATKNCVDNISEIAKDFFTNMQEYYWKGQKTTLEVKKLHTVKTKKGETNLSLSHHDMQMEEYRRELRKKGKIKARFIRKRLRLPKGYNIKEQVRTINNAYKRTQQRKMK